MMHRNFIVDVNRFKLAGPPAYFLKQLWDFDPSLVIVPSRQGCYYRLAQRRKLTLPEHITNDALFKESDTKMLASYSLIPVTTILPTANWGNPILFKDLSDRAPWRNGGAEKVTHKLEDVEQQQRTAISKQNIEMITDRAQIGWKMYQTKTGAKTFLNKHKILSPATAV